MRPHAWTLAGCASLFALTSCGSNPDDCSDPSTCTVVDKDGGDLDVGSTPSPDVPPIDRTTARPTDLVGIELAPQNPTLEASLGMRPAVTFRVVGRQRDGMTRDVTTSRRFTIDVASLGSIDESSGAFVGTGLPGVTNVRVALTDGTALTAQTRLTINARYTVSGPNVSMADRERFERATPTGDAAQAPLVDYPLEGAVMPQNVYPPKVMWTPRHPMAAPTDLYRVRFTRGRAIVEGYFRGDTPMFTHSWRPDGAVWQAVARAEFNEPITLTVAVLSSSGLRQSAPRAFRTVDGVIAGSVYYWSPPRSRVLRVDVDTARLVDFLPNPGDRCIGCHAVSRDGRHLAGFLEGSSETLGLYDLTRDLTGNPAPINARVRYTVRRCTSYNPDATRIVSGDCGANPSSEALSLIDGANGMPVRPAAGSPGNGFDPEWSPDGTAIAFTDRMDNLALTPVMAGDRFGTSQVIHTARSIMGGTIDWHPTWTPDSRGIAFQHGDSRRTNTGNASLWFIARAGGTPVRLDRANGGATVRTSFRPVFSPFDSGGYFWLLFTTNRPWGNARAGVVNQKQVWVTAIRNRPMAGMDPSEVPYYLDGQEAATALSPYWAPAPCRMNGAGCATGADCCSGACEPDSNGQTFCRPARTVCRMRGQQCSGDGDCCMGLVCNAARLCDIPPPM